MKPASKFHLRKNYEKLLIQLGFNEEKEISVNGLTDYGLFIAINEILIKNNCIPFTEDELLMELN